MARSPPKKKSARKLSALERAQVRIAHHRSHHEDVLDVDLDDPAFEDELEVVECFEPHELALHGLGLTEIPAEVFDLATVNTLILDDQPIEHLPKDLLRMTQLRRLDVSGTNIKHFPAWLREASLQELHARNAHIDDVGELVSEPLEVLVLDGNPLRCMPNITSAAGTLRVLSLVRCGLTTLHPSLWSAEALQELQLSGNRLKLTSGPNTFANLRSLQRLDLEKCGLTSLPASLADVPFSMSFEKLRVQRRARFAAQGFTARQSDELAAAPISAPLGLNLTGNRFKDSRLADAANTPNVEGRVAAVQAWCHEHGRGLETDGETGSA